MESPLASNSTNTRVGMSTYSFMICFHIGLDLSQISFLLTAHLHDISNLLCIGFKSKESPGHSKTDVSLLYVFCGFRVNTKNTTLHKY